MPMLLAIEEPPAEVIAALVELYDDSDNPDQASQWRERLPDDSSESRPEEQ